MMTRSATQATCGDVRLLDAARAHVIRPASFLTEGSSLAWYPNASEQPKPVGSTP